MGNQWTVVSGRWKVDDFLAKIAKERRTQSQQTGAFLRLLVSIGLCREFCWFACWRSLA